MSTVFREILSRVHWNFHIKMGSWSLASKSSLLLLYIMIVTVKIVTRRVTEENN